MLVLGVPTLVRYDLLQVLLASAQAGDLKPDRYIIVDNGQRLGRPSWLPEGAEVLTFGGNIGVSASFNHIMRNAGAEDHIVIVGDDVTLHSNTLSEMVRKADESDADFTFCAHAGPMFSCFLIRKRLFERIGGFDEVFWPAYYEDNDYHRRMKLAGATEAIAPCGYGHVGSATIQALGGDNGAAEANRGRYIMKWGGEPGFEQLTEPRKPWA